MTEREDRTSAPKETIEVIVVEDDYRVNEIHSTFVARTDGFKVVGNAFSGAQALNLIKDLRPDLVLLDVYLPDISGLEVLALIGRLPAPRPDVIIVSAAKDTASVRTAMQAGAVHFITKPFDAQSLTERLTSYRIFRNELADVAEFDQATIDKLWTSIRSTPEETPRPKGHSQHTTTLVMSALRQSKEALTAEEVAKRCGLSRTSTQRYLSYLGRLGKVDISLRYGAAGRPEHLYRWK